VWQIIGSILQLGQTKDYISICCLNMISWICFIGCVMLEFCEFKPRSLGGVLDTTLCDQVCQWLATGRWFSPCTLLSSTNKTGRHNITEILLKVALNTIIQPKPTMLKYSINNDHEYITIGFVLKKVMKFVHSIIHLQHNLRSFLYIFLLE
jgi:hypothetical protein